MSMYVVSSFQSTSNDLQVPVDFTHFFNTSEFLALKKFKYSRFILKNEDGVAAEINFTISHKVAISGYQATFGSFNIYAGITNSALEFFLRKIQQELAEAGVEQIEIRHWPAAYLLSDIVESALLGSGFRSICEDINQHLSISAVSFTSKIRHSERLKLAQCYRQGFSFKQEGPEALISVHDLVVKTLVRKSFPVTMSLEALTEGFQAKPESYLIFSVYDDHQLIAAAISLVINSSILYNFYHADNQNYRNFSPTVMLLEGIYQYCQNNNYSILDLGISSEKGITNEGLFNFKRNLGCEASSKHIFSKLIA